MKLPGSQLLTLARTVIDPLAVERILEPLVADWQREWLAVTTTRSRAIVWVRGVSAFVWSTGYCFVLGSTPTSLSRTASITLVSLTVLTVALDYASWISTLGAHGALWLVPGSIVMSPWFATLPLGIRLGAERHQRIAARRYLARMVFVMTTCAVIMTSWIFPIWSRIAIDRLTPSAIHRPLRMNSGELTLSELLSPDADRLIGLGWHSPPLKLDPRWEVERELHNRATLILIPVLLATLGWSMARASASAGMLNLALLTILNFALWVAFRGMPPVIPLPPLMSLWAPALVWTLSSGVLIRRSVRERTTAAHA